MVFDPPREIPMEIIQELSEQRHPQWCWAIKEAVK
jgi:hypothetical protein